MCLCAPGTACFFSTKSVFVVFMRKRTALFGRKLASEKEARLDKIGHFTKSVDISFDAFIHTPREREKERAYENDDRLLEVG